MTDALYTAAVTDVLDGLGYLEQTLPPEIGPLAPGMRVAGPAFAVEGRPSPGADYETSIRKVLEVLGAVPPAHVAVFAMGDRTCAQFGELSATARKLEVVDGVSLDGATPDV